MRKNFPGVTNPAFATNPSDGDEEGGELPAPKAPGDFDFSYKPRDVKSHLDRFVIKQDEAKKVLSVALCDHYNQVRFARENTETLNAFEAAIRAAPEVQECYMLMGDVDFLLRVVTRDVQTYEHFLRQTLAPCHSLAAAA